MVVIVSSFAIFMACYFMLGVVPAYFTYIGVLEALTKELAARESIDGPDSRKHQKNILISIEMAAIVWMLYPFFAILIIRDNLVTVRPA
jgi:hypothetical protein